MNLSDSRVNIYSHLYKTRVFTTYTADNQKGKSTKIR